jgi:hypothetical protein
MTTIKEQMKVIDDKLKEQDKRMEMKDRQLGAVERVQVRNTRAYVLSVYLKLPYVETS